MNNYHKHDTDTEDLNKLVNDAHLLGFKIGFDAGRLATTQEIVKMLTIIRDDPIFKVHYLANTNPQTPHQNFLNIMKMVIEMIESKAN